MMDNTDCDILKEMIIQPVPGYIWTCFYTIFPLFIVRVRMHRDFLNRLIEKYFEQLIDSVRVLRPHCRNVKENDFKHYCAAACTGTCQALDESVHQIWRNRFVYC